VGTDYLLSLHHEQYIHLNSTPKWHEAASFYCVKSCVERPCRLMRGSVSIISLQHVGNRSNEWKTQENCLRFWYRKWFNGWKICFVVNVLHFLSRKFYYGGKYQKRNVLINHTGEFWGLFILMFLVGKLLK
jgi:hypothetical protein